MNTDLNTILSKIQIVMVETSLPANIGSALRAMKTMGISQLVLVKPKHFPHPDIDALSAGASDFIPHIKVVETLADAIAESDLVFATSARSRSIPWPLVDARTAGEMAISHLIQAQQQQHHSQISIIFGRENHGLNNEELALANYHLHIPVNADYGVLNVAQAIQIICYEMRMTALAKQDMPKNTEQHIEKMPIAHTQSMIWDEPLATQAQMQSFYPHLEQMLIDIDFMQADNRRLLPLRLKRLFGRIQLDRMEYHLLRGIFTRVQALSHGTWQAPQKKTTDSNTNSPNGE